MMDTFVFLVATARMYSFVQIQLARVDAVGVDDHSSVHSGGWHQLVPLGTTMLQYYGFTFGHHGNSRAWCRVKLPLIVNQAQIQESWACQSWCVSVCVSG